MAGPEVVRLTAKRPEATARYRSARRGRYRMRAREISLVVAFIGLTSLLGCLYDGITDGCRTVRHPKRSGQVGDPEERVLVLLLGRPTQGEPDARVLQVSVHDRYTGAH